MYQGRLCETRHFFRPPSFRINGSGKFAKFLRDKMEENLVSAVKAKELRSEEGKILKPPSTVKWCVAISSYTQ